MDQFLRGAWNTAKVSAWARDRLGFDADKEQTRFLDSEAMDEILLWARQVGKTQIMGIRISHTAIMEPGSLQLVVSASQRQAGILQKRVLNSMRRLNMNTSARVVREIDLPEDLLDPDSRIVSCSVLQMQIANGSEVVSVPASPDTVRGYSPNDIYMDEASRIPDDVYQAVRPMRAAHPVRLTLASTPAWKMGFFYETWKGDDPAWWRSQVLAVDCPRITAEFLARERRTMPERNYQQEYECVFQDKVGNVFNEEWIASAFTRDVKPLFNRKGGLDPGVKGLGILKGIK
jgi:hypothetical protein